MFQGFKVYGSGVSGLKESPKPKTPKKNDHRPERRRGETSQTAAPPPITASSACLDVLGFRV